MLKMIFVFAVGLCIAGPALAGAPDMHISTIRYDFGKVFEKEKYEFKFTVENRGDAELEIREVSPSCGCTVADYDQFIPAGGKGYITFFLDGNKVEGRFEKSATVTTNDPNSPTMHLTIAGHEIPYVEAEPPSVSLIGIYGDEQTQEVTIWCNDETKNFQITRVESSLDDRVWFDTKPLEGGKWLLRVHKNPEMPVESTSGVLTMYTNSTEAPTKAIQVHVSTKGTITRSPEMVNFGRVQFGAPDNPKEQAPPITRSVDLFKTTGVFRITEVTFDNPLFSAGIVEIVPDQRYRLDVMFKPPTRSASRSRETGEMLIKTNDPQEPSMRIRLVASQR